MTTDQVQDTTTTFERSINAPAEQVYYALTNSVGLAEWLSNFAVSNVRAGGAIFLSWQNGVYVTGEFTELQADKAVVFTWLARGDSAASTVRVSLELQGDSTHVTLVHSSDDPTRVYDWEAALENLQSVLETGADLRVTRRAILGVVPTNFDADIAAEIGVPVSEGFRIAGTVPGTGAENAGLQNNDVIVEINGKSIRTGADVGAILGGKPVGYEVQIKFYRKTDTHEATFTLSPIPVPEVPETREALADAIAEIYTQLDDELHQLYDGVSDAVAAAAPAEGEWSANETVAHLIATEQWVQEWIGSLIDGPAVVAFSAHKYERAVALASTYDGKDAILKAMKRSQDETVALLRIMPDTIAARKSTFNAIGTLVLGMPNHNRQHFNQMRAAIAAAQA